MFSKHFVAAHQQVGDFKVVEVNGKLQKNGGNVASYFCTPEGRVIHAVTGPVAADELLAAAQWVLDTVQQMKEYPPRRQPAVVSLAHYNELGGMRDELNRMQPQIRGPWNPHPRRTQESQIHELLARRPLPMLDEVYNEIFEDVLGQRVSTGEAALDHAERGLMLAEETGKPVLFILHNHHENGPFYGEWRRRMDEYLRERTPLGALLDQYVLIVLPLEDLPAFSRRRVDQPPFRAPNRDTPLFVVADAAGRQRDAATGWETHQELTQKLGAGLIATLQERTPPLHELRRIVRFLGRVDRKLAGEAVKLVPKAQKEAAEGALAEKARTT